MTDEDAEIVFNTQVEQHTPSKAVASGLDTSDTKMDAIKEALQSISSQNKGIYRKVDVQVQEISKCFENLGPRVNKQAAQIESQFKYHGDKLALKINVFEEEFSNTVASLNAKHRSFEETVKNRLQETQEKLHSKLNVALQAFDGKETLTPVMLQMAFPPSILTPLSFSGVEPKQKRPIQKPPSFDGNHFGSLTSHSLK